MRLSFVTICSPWKQIIYICHIFSSVLSYFKQKKMLLFHDVLVQNVSVSPLLNLLNKCQVINWRHFAINWMKIVLFHLMGFASSLFLLLLNYLGGSFLLPFWWMYVYLSFDYTNLESACLCSYMRQSRGGENGASVALDNAERIPIPALIHPA